MNQGSSPFDRPDAGLAQTERPTVDPAVDPLLAGLGRPRTVLVAGGSGFVGRHLVRRLVSHGHTVRGLCRRPDADRVPSQVEWLAADVTRPDMLREAAEGCDVLIHLVGISAEEQGQTFYRVHLEGTRNLLDEATRANVSRFIFLSAVGARRGGSAFFRTKFAAEEEIRRSGLGHLIFRPSVIYGPDDHFTSAIAKLLRHLPVYPIPAIGSLRLQPICVDDVTDALAQAVTRTDLPGADYELGGPERLKFAKIVRIVARTLRVRRPILQLPGVLARPALRFASRYGLPMPITPQQLAMFREAGVLRRADNPLRTVFRIEPIPFRVAVADYL